MHTNVPMNMTKTLDDDRPTDVEILRDRKRPETEKTHPGAQSPYDYSAVSNFFFFQVMR